MNDAYRAANGQAPRDRTSVAVQADNIIRRRLRIGDPLDAAEVASGLRRLFDREARSQELEAQGLPLLPWSVAPPSAQPTYTPASRSELDQALDDVERDLRSLTTNSQLKDIEAELQGWGQAIRGIIADGTGAARLALDPRQRDRAFASRRQLGDYARVARLVGAMTATLSPAYRKLAQSLDEVAGLILVLAGEAIASSGSGGGRFLLAAPASELQARRDAVLLALRNLAGTTQQAYGNDEWPWGLHGFREILLRIETSGHHDLRVLLEEPALGRLMDELIDRASSHNTRGLRALGATADVALQQLHRFIQMIDDNVQPEVPAVTTLLKALQLFLDPFRSSRGGYRLLFIARPPLIFYGLYGIGGPDAATRRLLDIIIQRGRLAELLDCYLGCDCCGAEVLCQITLDKLLYDVDRAIDLYALGIDPDGDGEPERRAAAYGALIDAFLVANPSTSPTSCLARACFQRVGELVLTLQALETLLLSNKVSAGVPLALSDPARDADEPVMIEELCMQRLADRRWESLIATMAPSCVGVETVLSNIETLVDAALASFATVPAPTCAEPEIIPPPTTPTSLELLKDIRDLLGVQRQTGGGL